MNHFNRKTKNIVFAGMIVFSALSGVASAARAEENSKPVQKLPRIYPVVPGQPVIEQLQLNSVESLDSDEVMLEGYYPRAKWKLLVEYENNPLNINPEGKISRRVTLVGADTPLSLIAVGPHGEIQKQIVHILGPSKKVPVSNQKWFSFGVGAGYSHLDYSDSAIRFSQNAITPKASAAYRLPNADRWRVLLNGYATAYTFGKINYIDPVTVHFFGMNLKAGYDTHWLPEGWKLELQVGWYYSTMMVTNNYFGFSNANGPQVYPVLERNFRNGDSVGIYAKFSPVSSGGFLVLSPSDSYEIATGLYYVYSPSRDSIKYITSLDLSRLKLSVGGNASSLTSVTLGFGLGF